MGAGALGHSAAIYLAASGIGKIRIFDHDIVEESNLSRQIFFSYKDIGKQKAETLAKYIKKLHPDVKVGYCNKKFSKELGDTFFNGYHFIVNASDNFKARHDINSTSLELGIPWFDMGVLKTQGHFCYFNPGYGCYECLFPEIKDQNNNCSHEGVLSPICGIMGSFAANEIIKAILEQRAKNINQFITFNFLTNEFKKFYWQKNYDCLLCSKYNYLSSIKNSVLENINNFFINEVEISNFLTHENVIIDLDNSLKALNTKFNTKIINKNFNTILKSLKNKTELNENLNYLNNFNLVLFSCKFGAKSKIICEIFRQKGINCYFTHYNKIK